MRLFVAVWPPEEVLDGLERLLRPETPGIRWTARHQWHVTLRFLGSVPDEAPAAAALTALSTPVARVDLGPETVRLNPRILCAPVSGLDHVARAVVAATRSIGEPPDDRPFRGHVTLARARERRNDVRPLAGAPVAGSWEARSVELVSSTLHPEGARYDVVASFPLAAA